MASGANISGSSANDTLFGNQHNDTISALSGNDLVVGQSGNDLLTAGAGNDTVFAGEGAQLLSNTSFEDGIHYLNTVSYLTDWMSHSGSPDSSDDLGPEWNSAVTASEGTGYVSLVARPDSFEAIRQNLDNPLIAGHTYTFSVKAFSANYINGEHFTANGEPVLIQIIHPTTGAVLGSATVDSTSYENYSISFTPSSNMTDFAIRAYTNRAGEWNHPGSAVTDLPSIVIDQVSLTETSTLPIGGSDNDSVFGGDGNDLIYGGTGNDSISGDAGRDTLFGGIGNDTLRGDVPDGENPELLSNGSFEHGTHSSGSVAGLTGWSNGFGSPDSPVDTNSSTEWRPANTASDGTGYLTLQATTSGTFESVTQTLAEPLVSGQTYRFTFDAISAGWQNHVYFTPTDIPIYFDIISNTGQLLGRTTVQGTTYQTYSIEFTLSSNVTSITLRPRGTGTGVEPGIILDNASLVQISPPNASVSADSLIGDAGNDLIFGGIGNDTLTGGDGQDTLHGGEGTDIMHGGADADVFIADGTADIISDFDAATGVGDGNIENNDRVDLSSFYNTTTLSAWNAANPGQSYATPLAWMQADQANGVLEQAGGLRIEHAGVAVSASSLTTENTMVVCFRAGTLIATQKGEVAVEHLCSGDMVLTMDHGYQPIQWIGSTTVAGIGNLAPVLIRRGAMNNSRDLYVSQQHRMFLSSPQSELFLGQSEVLVAAKHLVDGVTILQIECSEIEYFHILFKQHEIIFAEGCPSESFHPGHVGWGALSEQTRSEILVLFPDLLDSRFASFGRSARRSLTSCEAALVRPNHGVGFCRIVQPAKMKSGSVGS